MTADEYLARGIRFYDGTAAIDLPNFPPNGIATALREAPPILDALSAIGFEVLDPATAHSLTRSRDEALVAAYDERQATVERVVALVTRRED